MELPRKKIKHEELFSQFSEKDITWKIRELGSLCTDTGYSMDSNHFDFENATWCLRLYPKSGETSRKIKTGIYRNAKEKGYIGLTLVRLCSFVKKHVIGFTFSWMEGPSIACCSKAYFDDDHRENGSMKFIHRAIAFERVYEIYKAAIVTLTCHIFSVEPSDTDPFHHAEIFIRSSKVAETLSESYKNLLQNEQDYDVVLKVQDRDFLAHRNILRVRSPVIASMLNLDMTEKKSGVINIPDCDPITFEQFLSFVYCAKVDTLSADNILSLYYIADKYDVGDLKEECRIFIENSLSVSNIADVIEVALNHSDAALLQSATDYFMKEVNEILPTVEWQSFLRRNSTHANELMIKAFKNLNGGKKA